ncbi:MAG: transcription-repair coupling factor, partial [Bacteroidales bacterium]|nr:transcription-repair coupling factor [Bacteroidales bacterium]
MISKQDLSDMTINLEVGHNYDTTELENHLLELGFNRTDYVYEPGQFAIRGSIIDIYSFSNDEPYRIDFFGDEIESIRIFDIQTQLSDKKITSISIIPNFDSSDIEYISLLDFISEKTVIIAKDFEFIADRIEIAHNEGFSRQALLSSSTDEKMMSHTDFISNRDEFVNSIKRYRRLFIRSHNYDTAQKDNISIEFSTLQQPLFHKNFELLTQEFENLINEGYTINIFSENEHQIRRLEDIFDANRKEKLLITFNAINKAIHEGFIDKNHKQCYFTDHQIFDRYHKYNLRTEQTRTGKVALTLKELQQFEIGDYVVHLDHGVGRFGGLVRIPNGNKMQEVIKIIYNHDDVVFVSIHALHKVSKYKGKEGEPPRISTLGTGAWERMKERTKTKIKDLARDLINLYRRRREEKGFSYSPDS